MTLSKVLVLVALAGVAALMVACTLGNRDPLELNASVSAAGDRLELTLADREGVRIIGNEGACGEGGCIMPLSYSELALDTGSDGPKTFSLAIRRDPEKPLSCSTILHIDDGRRLRHFRISVHGESDSFHAHVEELPAEKVGGGKTQD